MSNSDDPTDIAEADVPLVADVAADAAVPPPPETAKVIIQRRNGVPALVGGILAAAVGFGTAQLVPGGWPVSPSETVLADLAALRTELAALQGKVAEIPAPDDTLAGRIATLESTPVSDLTSLSSRIAALEKQPAPLATVAGDGINVATSVLSAQARDIATLKAGVAALQTGGVMPPDMEVRLAEAEARAAAIAEQTVADANDARRQNALDRLEIALETGAPYASVMSAFGDIPVPSVVGDHAKTGLPTLQALQAGFPDAARTALDASLRVAADETWTGRAATFLRSQTGARSLTPREGSDPDAVLSRADAAVADGRIADAMTELGSLPTEGQAAMAAWLEQASLHLTAQQAVADLRTAMSVE